MTTNLILFVFSSIVTISASHSVRKEKNPEITTIKIKPDRSYPIGIREPSDMVFSAESNSIFVVSDNGFIAEIDTSGQLIRKSDEIGTDFEAITLFNDQLVVVDETPRRFSKVNTDFGFIEQKRLTYNGGRNKGFESICWHPEKKCFISITEKDPATIFEIDQDFNVTKELPVPFKLSDVSALTYHNDYLWILSDEDRTVYKCNPTTYMPEKTYLLPLINPEGITFNSNGDMLVCSDDMERLYIFNHQSL